ncbi:glycoside hydrolase family protein [Rickettsia hoogstraalii]|nr:glycoside hydrolase family protein [Rickettsia hoogstraalii]MCX4084619.1 glycoside hydrolase family protein [Rickettsia hoogstraalii]
MKQQVALISFIFNFGSGKFQASILRQKLNRGEYLNAANELLCWVHAKDRVKLQGLVKLR